MVPIGSHFKHFILFSKKLAQWRSTVGIGDVIQHVTPSKFDRHLLTRPKKPIFGRYT